MRSEQLARSRQRHPSYNPVESRVPSWRLSAVSPSGSIRALPDRCKQLARAFRRQQVEALHTNGRARSPTPWRTARQKPTRKPVSNAREHNRARTPPSVRFTHRWVFRGDETPTQSQTEETPSRNGGDSVVNQSIESPFIPLQRVNNSSPAISPSNLRASSSPEYATGKSLENEVLSVVDAQLLLPRLSKLRVSSVSTMKTSTPREQPNASLQKDEDLGPPSASKVSETSPDLECSIQPVNQELDPLFDLDDSVSVSDVGIVNRWLQNPLDHAHGYSQSAALSRAALGTTAPLTHSLCLPKTPTTVAFNRDSPVGVSSLAITPSCPANMAFSRKVFSPIESNSLCLSDVCDTDYSSVVLTSQMREQSMRSARYREQSSSIMQPLISNYINPSAARTSGSPGGVREYCYADIKSREFAERRSFSPALPSNGRHKFSDVHASEPANQRCGISSRARANACLDMVNRLPSGASTEDSHPQMISMCRALSMRDHEASCHTTDTLGRHSFSLSTKSDTRCVVTSRGLSSLGSEKGLLSGTAKPRHRSYKRWYRFNYKSNNVERFERSLSSPKSTGCLGNVKVPQGRMSRVFRSLLCPRTESSE